jgi:hypothetical protein
MVLHGGDQHFIAGLHAGAAEGLRNEIDAFCRAAHENDLVGVRGVDESLCGLARCLVVCSRRF